MRLLHQKGDEIFHLPTIGVKCQIIKKFKLLVQFIIMKFKNLKLSIYSWKILKHSSIYCFKIVKHSIYCFNSILRSSLEIKISFYLKHRHSQNFFGGRTTLLVHNVLGKVKNYSSKKCDFTFIFTLIIKFSIEFCISLKMNILKEIKQKSPKWWFRWRGPTTLDKILKFYIENQYFLLHFLQFFLFSGRGLWFAYTFFRFRESGGTYPCSPGYATV